MESLLSKIPEPAKDLRLNLGAVLSESTLSETQRWGVAVASALAARNPVLVAAVLDTAAGKVEAAVIDDARAAAALMAMNNVYYRFRHVIGKEAYEQKPARLRMQRIAKPASNKVDFELFCLAVSAINNCQMCMQSHEAVVVQGGLSDDQVHDAIRIAAVVHGVAMSLELGTA